MIHGQREEAESVDRDQKEENAEISGGTGEDATGALVMRERSRSWVES